MLFVIGGFFVVLAAAVGLYFTFGLHAISLGCRGFGADCYIPAAQFSKDMQALAVMMFLGTAMLLFGYVTCCLCSRAWSWAFKKYLADLNPTIAGECGHLCGDCLRREGIWGW